MHRLVGTLAIAGLIATGACGNDDGDSTSTSATKADDASTTSTAPGSTNDCIAVNRQTLENLGIDGAYGFGPLGTLSTGKDAYFVATTGGAVWVTNYDPATDAAGLVLPLNSQARSASEVGADMSEDAPILNGIDSSNPGAVRALDCAQDPEQDG